MPHPPTNSITASSLNSGITILILSQAERDRDIYCRYLQSDHLQNFRILDAQTLAQGWELWRSQRPNLTLIDGLFPDGDGLTFLAAMREEISDQKLPVILVVEQAEEPIALQAVQRGAIDYLIKNDLSPALLSYCLRSVLERLDLLRSLQQERAERPWREPSPLKRTLGDPAIARSETEAFQSQGDQNLKSSQKGPTATLQKQELDLPNFLDNVTDLIQSISPDGRFLYVNRAWKETLGYDEEDLKHLSIFQIMQPDSHAHCRAMMNTPFQGATCLGMEAKLRTKTGQEIVVEGNINCHYEEGQVISTRGIFRDVTDRRQMEAELAESEAKFRHLVEGAKDLIWACDIAGIFTYLSPQYKVIFGWEAQDWIGQSLAPLVHPEDALSVQVFTKKMLTQEEPSEDIEFRHLHKDGHYVWIQCKETIVRNPEGMPIGFQGIIRDISDRKLAEQQLAEKNIILHSVIDGTPDIIYVKDLQGQYVVANAAFAHFLGVKIKAIIGAEDTEIFSPELVHQIQETDHRIMATGVMETFEEDIHLKETRRTFLTTKLPWRSAQGEIMGVIGIARDISDHKQAEAQLQNTNLELSRATRHKNEFLANMSHELRTPLNSILGMSECLQEGIFSPLNPQQMEAVSTIQKSSHHLLDLINDILDLSKIEAGKLELQRELVTVKSLCDTSLLFVRELALKKQIQLSLTIQTALTQIFVDPRRIMQVLINLLTNGVKFTSEGGQVSLVVVRETETSLSFSVVDTGIGIAPESINLLFQPFLQIDSRLNRQQMGTGLGLNLVKHIMELHGGTVSVTSEVGVGSRFKIELPTDNLTLISPDSESQPSPKGTDVPLSLTPDPPLILLVENNDADVRSISSYLLAKGFRLRVAKNGQEAITFAQTDHPNLILMGMNMAGMDGIATLRQFSRDRQLTPIPIIVLTASALTHDHDRYLAAGAKDTLSKPIKLRLLTSIIQKNLGIRG